MKRRTIIILLFLGLLLPEIVVSQHSQKAKQYFVKAKRYYWTKNYGKAKLWIKRTIKVDSKFESAYLLKGEIAEEERDTAEAISCYKDVITIDSFSFPAVYYYLGELYYNLGKYDKSAKILKNYLKKIKIISNILQVKRLLKCAEYASQAKKHPWDIEVRNTSDSINTEADEYINFVNETKTVLYFTRKEPLQYKGINGREFTEKIYISKSGGNFWHMPYSLLFPWENRENMGAVSFSVDSRLMYFTGCYLPSGMGSCDIYFSRKYGDRWLMPFNAGSMVNSSKWDSQAVLSSDGKTLFFSSKRGGGKGGSDLWYCTMTKEDRWGYPVNAGDSVNTPYDEMSPFLFASNSRLYFSSSGHAGMGGYDLFMATKDSTGMWSKVINLGYPINGKYNEINIFISLDATHAWISSDRQKNNGGFDIYDFQLPNSIAPEAVYYFKGITLSAKDKKPLSADIILTDLKSGKELDSTRSDAINGSFLTVIQQNINYAVNITKKGYLFLSKNINTQNKKNKFSNICDTFYLQPIDTGCITNLYNINFDFDKYTIKSSAFPELKRLLYFLQENPSISIEIAGHTDFKGSAHYNKVLSVRRAKSVYKYLINNGIDYKRLEYRGYGFLQPLCTEKSEACSARNRRTEIKITGK